MKVKKFVAPTMPEAMKKIRSEMGQDAVILQSKEIKQGGFLGLFKKRKFEVIAALDRKPIKRTKKQPVPITPKKKNVDENQSNRELMHEIKHLKRIIEAQGSKTDSPFHGEFDSIYHYLLGQEVLAKIAKEIAASLAERYDDQQRISATELLEKTEQEIQQRLQHLSFEGISEDAKILHFIGPTGVGKTTTLAKLAAHCMLQRKKKIAFITTDTYRIAAIEQLKTYARILDVPVEVAFSLNEYKQAVEKLSNQADLIFVDTAGRNFRHQNYVEELTQQIETHDQADIFLVMSLTAKAKDIQDIYNIFSHLENKKVIFTKLDETNQYGSMLNIALDEKADIAYLTDGQDVPDDLIEPSPSMISQYIMSDYYDQ